MEKTIRIQISKVILYILVFLLVGSGSWFIYSRGWHLPPWLHRSSINAAGAAEDAVITFYTMDYREGMEAWVEKLCLVSSPQGCEISRQYYGPMLWPGIAANKTRTTITVIESEKFYDQQESQIWRVRFMPGEIWVGLPIPPEAGQDVYVLIDPLDNNQWGMHHLLTDVEVQLLCEEVDHE